MTSIKDVAKLAGVSVGTASNVINKVPTVKEVSRQKVEWAIKELGYIPNEVARNFKMQRSTFVALLLPSINHPFFSALAFYIEEELDKYGYKLILCNSGGKPEKELYYLEMLIQNKVAGIVGITYNNVFKNVSSEIPIISIDRHLTNHTICVTSDNAEGGRIAVDKLIESGAQKLAFIGAYSLVSTETMNRAVGFSERAQERQIPFVLFEEEDPIVDMSIFCRSFLSQHPDVDGVFAITDMMAAALIQEAKNYGKEVPIDLRVIGFDGIQDSTYFHPVLSTIKQPVKEMAVKTIQLLFDRIEGKTIEKKTFKIPVTFIQGETT